MCTLITYRGFESHSSATLPDRLARRDVDQHPLVAAFLATDVGCGDQTEARIGAAGAAGRMLTEGLRLDENFW